jgi:hypothetical protein
MEMVLMAAEQVARNPDIASVRMNVLGRHGELDILLTVLDRVPRIYPYQKGDTFIPYLLHAPIPRALWPSKPILDIGHRFSILFRDDPQKKLEKGTSISIGTVAELYYNFGYWGLLACPIFGMVVRFFWERWKHYFQVEACASIRLPFLLFSVAGFGADTAGLASDVLELIIVPVTLYIFMMAFYGRRPKVLRWRSAPSVP